MGIQWEIGVFPHTKHEEKTVLWNAVVRRKFQDEPRWTIRVLAPVDHPDTAKQMAISFIQSQIG